MFPVIRHINDVLPAIEGREEFFIAERNGYKIINYHNPLSDSFDQSPMGLLRAECRGIIFDDNGNIIRRPFHKFHNIGEKDWTRQEYIDLNKEHAILEKLDGSMIAPFIVNNELIWATKMAAQDFHNTIKQYIISHNLKMIEVYAWNMIEEGITPIFEWTSPSNRIVVSYAEDRLTLLALRDMETGEYYNELENPWIPVVQSYNTLGKNIDQIISYTRDLKDQEGFVIRWNNGSMVKIKADDYVRMHKAKDSIMLEKHVLEIIFNEQLDDLLPLLNDIDKSRLQEYNDNVMKAFELSVIHYFDALKVRISKFSSRKDYAISPEYIWDKNNKTILPGIIFAYFKAKEVYPDEEPKFFSKEEIYEILMDYIKDNLSSSTKIDRNVKPLIGDHSWSYNIIKEWEI